MLFCHENSSWKNPPLPQSRYCHHSPIARSLLVHFLAKKYKEEFCLQGHLITEVRDLHPLFVSRSFSPARARILDLLRSRCNALLWEIIIRFVENSKEFVHSISYFWQLFTHGPRLGDSKTHLHLLAIMREEDVEVAIKVVVVGNGAVGKSSMIQRYCKGIFTKDYKKTIGVDFLERQVR